MHYYVPSDGEVLAFLEQAYLMRRAGRIAQHHADLFTLMAFAGLSPKRALALRWAEIEPCHGGLGITRRMDDMGALRRLVLDSWENGHQADELALERVAITLPLGETARAVLRRRSKAKPFVRHVFSGRKRANAGDIASARGEFDDANWTRKALGVKLLPPREPTTRAARLSVAHARAFAMSEPMVFPQDQWAYVRVRARVTHLMPDDLQWWRLSQVLYKREIGGGIRISARMLYGVERARDNHRRT